MSISLIFFVIAGIVWLVLTISGRSKGNKHHNLAREHAGSGNWEGAVKEYKLAIISRLESYSKLQELITELNTLYQEKGHSVDLGQLLECPTAIKRASAGSQRKMGELMTKIYKEAGDFLDNLPGPTLD